MPWTECQQLSLPGGRADKNSMHLENKTRTKRNINTSSVMKMAVFLARHSYNSKKQLQRNYFVV